MLLMALDKSNDETSSLIERTEDANGACLLFADSSKAITATKSPHWKLGKNYFIRRENIGHPPFGPTPYVMTALESKTFIEANFWSGYDIAVPMVPRRRRMGRKNTIKDMRRRMKWERGRQR